MTVRWCLFWSELNSLAYSTFQTKQNISLARRALTGCNRFGHLIAAKTGRKISIVSKCVLSQTMMSFRCIVSVRQISCPVILKFLVFCSHILLMVSDLTKLQHIVEDRGKTGLDWFSVYLHHYTHNPQAIN